MAQMQYNKAESSTLGDLLIIAIVVIVIGLFLAILWNLFSLNLYDNALAPPIIKIIGINHGGESLESQVVIRSYSGEELDNDRLMTFIQVNGIELLARINTLQGHDFIPTRHLGVKTIGGSGCRGQFFSPGESIVIDLKNGYIKPHDKVELLIYQRSSDSRMPPFRGSLLDRTYVKEYESEYVFKQMKDYRLFSQHCYTA